MRTYDYLQNETPRVLSLTSFILNECFSGTLNYLNMPFKSLSSPFKPPVEPPVSVIVTVIAEAPKQCLLSAPSRSSWRYREYSRAATTTTNPSKVRSSDVQTVGDGKCWKHQEGRESFKQRQAGVALE